MKTWVCNSHKTITCHQKTWKNAQIVYNTFMVKSNVYIYVITLKFKDRPGRSSKSCYIFSPSYMHFQYTLAIGGQFIWFSMIAFIHVLISLRPSDRFKGEPSCFFFSLSKSYLRLNRVVWIHHTFSHETGLVFWRFCDLIMAQQVL